MKLTWSKEPRPTGLEAIYCHPQGAILKWDGVVVARASGTVDRNGRVQYHWYTLNDKVPFRNSAAEGLTYLDLEQAKVVCKGYVRSALSGA